MSIFESKAGVFFIGQTCYKCSGTGKVDITISRGNEDSICFGCKGRGIDVRGKSTFATREEALAHEAKLDRAAAKREAKELAAWEAGKAEREANAELNAAAEEARKAAEEAELASWSYLDGYEGDGVLVSGIVKTALSFDGKFGASRLIVIATPAKQLVAMFTTSKFAWSVEEDQELTVSGFISKFDVRDGKKQTVIRNVKVAL
jgi:hypothetical protein